MVGCLEHVRTSTSHPIDVIVTDEVMPGEIQGHDLVNKFYGHIPIVLMTGYSEPKNINGLEDVLLNHLQLRNLSKKYTQ